MKSIEENPECNENPEKYKDPDESDKPYHKDQAANERSRERNQFSCI